MILILWIAEHFEEYSVVTYIYIHSDISSKL